MHDALEGEEGGGGVWIEIQMKGVLLGSNIVCRDGRTGVTYVVFVEEVAVTRSARGKSMRMGARKT